MNYTFVAYNETSELIVGLLGSCNSGEEMEKKIEQTHMPSYIKVKCIEIQKPRDVPQ